jgi:hypothetical protein
MGEHSLFKMNDVPQQDHSGDEFQAAGAVAMGLETAIANFSRTAPLAQIAPQ